jgi:hypothetical protein
MRQDAADEDLQRFSGNIERGKAAAVEIDERAI